MPFTFAHPAIVLPLNPVFKRRLSLTGLVIGSMAPDFEYFLRMKVLSLYSHTWQGLIWFDVPLAYALVIIYELFIKDPLINHLPASLNQRFFGFKGFKHYYSAGYLVIILISVLLGAASHIFWDEFTHAGGYFVHRTGPLSHIVRIHGHRFYIFSLLWYASTAAGGLLILWVVYLLPRGKATRAKHITAFWLQMLLVTVVVVVIRLAGGLPLHQYGKLIVTVIDGALLGIVVASLLADTARP